MRLLVCGDRNWTDYQLIRRKIEEHYEMSSTLIEGEARGADLLARSVANVLGMPIMAFPAHWNLYGKAAGPIRNATMLREGKPDLVLAFHDDIEHSKGTKDMLQKAKAAGVPAILVSHAGERNV